MIVWNKNKAERVGARSAGLSLVRRLLEGAAPGRALALGVAPCDDHSEAARELAESCAAKAALRVLLVRVRPREPQGDADGWRQFSQGQASLPTVIRTTGLAELHELPAGSTAGESPSREALRAAVVRLRDRYDVVLFDLAGEDYVAEGRELASFLDGVLLVLPGPHPQRDEARRVKRRLERAGAKVLGVILEQRQRLRDASEGRDSAAREPAGMRPANVLSLLGGRADQASAAALGPLTAAELRRAVTLERIRADRTRQGFALLLWSFERPTAGGDEAEWFTVSQSRLRATDVVGPWDAHRMAVLLPDTNAGGADKLANDLLILLERQELRGRFEVFTHDPAPASTNDDSPLPPVANGNGEPNDVRFRAGGPAAAKNGSVGAATCAATPVEELLVRKLPWWKRLLDALGASIGLLLLSPLLLLAALAIKLTSRGPVLFWQARSGLGGRPFLMVKFRTMAVDAAARQAELRQSSEQDGPAFKLKRDPRVTWLGRWLRKTSIDELPQLWNVLKGEMTLVGPRPLPCDETDACQPWQRRRLAVTPGLTCFWQVDGRSQISFDDWMRSDLRYVRRRSLWTDLRLILRTVPAVLLGRGAH